jgi:hypothetical protein
MTRAENVDQPPVIVDRRSVIDHHAGINVDSTPFSTPIPRPVNVHRRAVSVDRAAVDVDTPRGQRLPAAGQSFAPT